MQLLFFISSDHPQFQVVFDYNPQQPDELSLVVGDVIRVFKKMADGECIFEIFSLAH